MHIVNYIYRNDKFLLDAIKDYIGTDNYDVYYYNNDRLNKTLNIKKEFFEGNKFDDIEQKKGNIFEYIYRYIKKVKCQY